MIKKMRLFYVLLIVIPCFLASCTTTTVMTDTWKDKNYIGKPQKIILIMAAKSPDMRNLFEDRFSGELQSRGNNANQSYITIPFEQLRDKELVKSKIKNSGADVVIISRLVDTKTIESYNPGMIYVVPASYYDWWGYYAVVFADYGYTGEVAVAYIETNVYDVNTGKLVWSGHSKTEKTYGEQELITAFIKLMIRKLSSAGIIK